MKLPGWKTLAHDFCAKKVYYLIVLPLHMHFGARASSKVVKESGAKKLVSFSGLWERLGFQRVLHSHTIID